MKKLSKPICIVICENFLKELQHVIEVENLQNIIAKTIPSCEFHLRDDWEEIIKKINQYREKYHVILLGGSCIIGLGSVPKEFHDLEYYRIECRDLFLNKSLLQKYVKEGAYIAIPNWLTNWKENIKTYGINQDIILSSFKDISKIALLDTGIYEGIEENLKEFSEYLQIPYEIIPIGLDFFTLHLKNILLEHEMKQILTEKKDEKLEQVISLLGVDSPSIENEEVGHVFILVTIWDDKIGPNLINFYPKKFPSKMEPDEISFQLFRAVESIYGKEKIKHAKGFSLEIDNIDMQGYLFFDKVLDPEARGKERQFMLAVLAPKINYFESMKISEILKMLSNKIKEDIDWNIIDYWEKVTNVLTNPVI